MPRASSGVPRKRRTKKILKAAKGFFGGSGSRYKMAKEAVMKAGVDAYRSRKFKKREYRSLWIVRITAAARMRGLSYNKVINALIKAKIDLNRKMLSELAIHDPAAFDKILASAGMTVKQA